MRFYQLFLIVAMLFGCQTVPDVECKTVIDGLIKDHRDAGRQLVQTGADRGGVEGFIFANLESGEQYVEMFVPPVEQLPASYPKQFEPFGFVQKGQCYVKSKAEAGEEVSTTYTYYTKQIKP